MQFPKRFMRKQELINMGLPEAMLLRAYRERGQKFARKADPLKANSLIVFDTDGLGKRWEKQMIVTDVVRENNQTYRLGWTEQCKDGSKMGVGCPEYILLFRKLPSNRTKAYADIPVEKSKEDYTRARWQIDAHAY